MNSNQLPVSGGIAVFFAVIIGYFVIDPSALEGFRPGGDGSRIEQVHGIEDVQARLWQDPFAAAAAHQRAEHRKTKLQQFQFSGKVEIPPLSKEEATPIEMILKPTEVTDTNQTSQKNKHSFQAFLNQIKIQSRESGQDVDVLAVMVSARPYAEDRETRLRRRYAVIGGLAASGYQPQDAANIGYVDKLKDSGCREGHLGEGEMPKLMPFEWFKNGGGRYSLLLWLDEDAFSYSPLCKLNFLMGKISLTLVDARKKNVIKRTNQANGNLKAKDLNSAYNKAEEAIERSRISIIGPSESGTLQSMLAELRDTKKKSNEDVKFPDLEDIFFFSATATAEAGVLIKGNTETGGDEWKDPVAKKFLTQRIIFFRTIADDRKLTDQLVQEIRKRLFDWDYWIELKRKEKNFQIALVSESDTLYGRSLPDAFIASAYQEFNSKQDKEKRRWAQEHIYRFSYLRGIDGKVSSTRKAKEDKLSKTKADDAKNDHMERPEGTSQKDYLRRLATDMARTHQRLKNEGTKGIRAIGVLGSDVYDKLLILRALRKQFPKAIFFTTDLDAALLHPDQFQWTRNMLVASSFDLKIASYSVIRRMKKAAATDAAKKYLQMLLDLTEITIPQNRDVYQTSVFLSTIWAVNPTPSLGLKDNIEMEIRSVEKKEDKLINRAINNLKKDVGNDNAPKTLDDLLKKMFGKYLIVIEETIQNAIQKGFHQSFGQYIKPRVYEIGRRGAVDLTALDNKNEGIDQARRSPNVLKNKLIAAFYF